MFTKLPEYVRKHYLKEVVDAEALIQVSIEPVKSYHQATLANAYSHLGMDFRTAVGCEEAIAGIQGTRLAYLTPYLERHLTSLEKKLSGLSHSDVRRVKWLEVLERIEAKKGPQESIRRALGFSLYGSVVSQEEDDLAAG